ncbi:MAG: hypothetical protein HN576_05890 [Bacteriovoracaceae bacterium]|jgi:hypothetical protein|nr:hypothetical protein [Bacteriovoracaceae bacterium]
MAPSNSLISKLIVLVLICFTTQTMAEEMYNVSQGRINAQDNTDITKEAMAGLENHKKRNGGKIVLASFKPVVMQELYSYLEHEHISRLELTKIKMEYERLEASSRGLSQKEIEKSLISLFENMMKYVNNSSLQCVKQGATCNDWGCCKGLTCAAVPARARENMGQCRRFNNTCNKSSDCCSGVCGEGVNGKKVCAVVRRCYRPQRANASCDKNPTCEVGSCEVYNAGTTGMGECFQNKNSCKSDDQCCSAKCSNNKCVPHYTCKNCVGPGIKPRRAEVCCEGHYKDSKGTCIPMLVPFVLKEHQMKKNLSLLGIFVSLIFGDVAMAETQQEANSRIKSKIQNDSSLVDEEHMKGLTGMSKRVRDNVKITDLDDFKDHQLETFSTKAGTDFKTCRIDLKADYLLNLKANSEQNMLGIEMAVLAFEHMVLGEGTVDYWTESIGGAASTNIHARAAVVAQKHADQRTQIFDELDDWQLKMECLCWDSKGYPNLAPDIQAKYAGAGWPVSNVPVSKPEEGTKTEGTSAGRPTSAGADAQCPNEMNAYLAYRAANPNTDDEDYAGDASGVKGKFLITKWTDLNRNFYTRVYLSNSSTFQEIYSLASWLESNNWGENTTASFQINRFTTKEWKNNPNIYAAVTLALIAAGVVAISGGFATVSMAALWGLGIGSMMLIGVLGAMKGAWESRAPYLQDEFIKTWKCGKKSYCSDFKRRLILPKSKVCGDKYVSGNGCIKNFLAYTLDGEVRHLVDPLVPVGVDKSVLLKDGTPLASRMSTAASNAIEKLKTIDQDRWRKEKRCQDTFMNTVVSPLLPNVPGSDIVEGVIGNAPGMNTPVAVQCPRLHTSYLKKPLLDSLSTGEFAPILKTPYANNYELTAAMIKTIKDSAKAYATNAKYLFSDMQEDLNKFADYSFDYHFVWPRLSQAGMIAYPMPGLISYFMLMAEAMNEKQDENFGNVEGYNQLHAQHLQDLINTINGSNNMEEVNVGIDGINSQLDAFNTDLANTLAFNGLNLSAGDGIDSSKANITGGNGSAAELDSSLGAGSLDPDSSLGRAASAFRKNREILDKQREKLSVFTAAVGAKKASELTANKKAFTKSFFSPLGAGGGLNLASTGAASGGPSRPTDSKVKNEKRDLSQSSLNARPPTPNYNLSYDTGGGSRSNYKAATEAAQSKIKEAIEFRNQKPAQFEKQEGDTLFKIITRSYIRSYDKLLNKRKKTIIDEDY